MRSSAINTAFFILVFVFVIGYGCSTGVSKDVSFWFMLTCIACFLATLPLDKKKDDDDDDFWEHGV